MKKNFATLCTMMLAALGFWSCSNDDIESVNVPTNLTVDTRGVFEFEGLDEASEYSALVPESKSDLYSIPTSKGYQVRVRNLVYNNKGVLMQDYSSFSNTYANRVNTELKLPKGQYTVITLTDVVQKNSRGDIEFRYWQVCDSASLNSTKIKTTGYIGQYTLLATACTKVNISGDGQTYTITPKPAGSYVLYWYRNVKNLKINGEPMKFAEYQAKQIDDALHFSEQGNDFYTDVRVSSQWDWRHSNINQQTKYQNIYEFNFVLEQTDVPMRFYVQSENYYGAQELGKVDFPRGVFKIAMADMGDLESEGKLTAVIADAKIWLKALQQSSAPAKMPAAKNIRNMMKSFGNPLPGTTKKMTTSTRLIDIVR